MIPIFLAVSLAAIPPADLHQDLERSEAPTVGTGSPCGVLYMSDGKGGAVLLPEKEIELYLDHAAVAKAAADARGEFQFPPIARGEYTLGAPGFLPTTPIKVGESFE